MDMFNYFNPNDCDEFDKLNGIDLQDFLVLLDDYYIEYRNNLEIDKNNTYGFEVEFEKLKVSKQKLNIELHKIFPDNTYYVKPDGSLYEGAEIATPVYTNTKENWEDLKRLCQFVKKYAQIDKKAGGHIHIGTQILGSNGDYWMNFAKLWSTYENIIYRFGYGKYLTSRSDIDLFAAPLSCDYHTKYDDMKNKDLNVYQTIAKLKGNRRRAVNLNNINSYILDVENLRNTIEFRCPNGTLDEVIWQNNLNLFINLLEYTKNDNFDHDIVDKRYEENYDMGVYDNLGFYDEVYLDQALELVDLIFDKNVDKINFLKQYLKSFKTVSNSHNYNLVCEITK